MVFLRYIRIKLATLNAFFPETSRNVCKCKKTSFVKFPFYISIEIFKITLIFLNFIIFSFIFFYFEITALKTSFVPFSAKILYNNGFWFWIKKEQKARKISHALIILQITKEKSFNLITRTTYKTRIQKRTNKILNDFVGLNQNH